MSTIINARSPYYLKYQNNTNTLTNVKIELKIWSGLKTAVPTTIDYTISKQPLVAEIGNYVVFEISELIRDYLLTEYYTEATDAVWVEVTQYRTFSASPIVSTSTFLSIDGFGYFEEKVNPRSSTNPNLESYTPMVLQSNMCIQFVRGRDIKLPIFSETSPTIETDIPLGVWNYVDDFWENSDPLWNATSVDLNVTDSDNSEDKIQYVVISTDNAQSGETITITSTVGNPQVQTITIEEICEPKFDAYRGIFYNKFGALQTMWFPKKSVIKTKTKDETYNSNTISYDPNTVSYSTTKHNTKRFNVIARQGISLNTTFLADCYNEPIEQLLMSEQVWTEFPNNNALETLPIIITTSGQTRKTGLNDKVDIQYNFDFDFAYEKINNVR